MRRVGFLVGALLLGGLAGGAVSASSLPPSLAQSPNIFIPPPAKKGYSYPECFCTDSVGQRVDLGETSCLRIGSQEFLARCDKSLNNTIWRRISDGCPTV